MVKYMAGIHSNFILYGLDTSAFKDESIHFFPKSLKYTRKFSPKVTQIICHEKLSRIIPFIDIFQFPMVFKALYLFFFSFLRLANILPHTMASFDPTRQLCSGSLPFSPSL